MGIHVTKCVGDAFLTAKAVYLSVRLDGQVNKYNPYAALTAFGRRIPYFQQSIDKHLYTEIVSIFCDRSCPSYRIQ
jgi:hypothetical protein